MDKRSYRTAGSQRLRTRPAPAHDDDLWRRHGAIAGRCATGRSYAPFRMPLCQALLRCWLTSRGCDNCAGAQAAAGRMQAGAHPTRAGSLRLLRADRGWGYTYAMHASSVRVTAIDSAACMPVGNLNFTDGAALQCLDALGAATSPGVADASRRAPGPMVKARGKKRPQAAGNGRPPAAGQRVRVGPKYIPQRYTGTWAQRVAAFRRDGCAPRVQTMWRCLDYIGRLSGTLPKMATRSATSPMPRVAWRCNRASGGGGLRSLVG